jgi:hypothetical protein
MRLDLLVAMAANCKTTMPAVYGDGMCHASANEPSHHRRRDMSEVKIKRRQRNVSITLSTSTSSATTLRLDDMAGAVLSMGTVSTNASTLHIYAAEAEDGSYRRLYDNAGSPANITLAASTTEGHAYSFP